MKNIQTKIENFCIENNLTGKAEVRLLDLVSEIGEVSKEILKSSDYGKREYEVNESLELEVGDLFFSLVTLANSLQIDLEEALEKVLMKYRSRIEKGNSPDSSNE
jgi:NTP pyrophosphatase (non-canonical NTP hydrolase)